ncbi:rCG24605 [Rattus norvegicus]|uniref:RCG24605 n=1 Tax=Rattus norvegicus TaxID=10116 RepID=A6JBV7_RAT|nr:rCG24605 [Rattus norvegicus]
MYRFYGSCTSLQLGEVEELGPTAIDNIDFQFMLLGVSLLVYFFFQISFSKLLF